MPVPNAPSGADISFDELFGVEDGSYPRSQAPDPATASPAPQADDQFFLKTGSTVYKTLDDAVKGTEHKDAWIARAREYQRENNLDENFQPRGVPNAPAPAAPVQPETSSQFKYLNNAKGYFEDLSQAASKGDYASYQRIQQEAQLEFNSQQFAPVVPLLSEVARNKAIREVSGDIKDFNTFVDSEDYRETLKQNPVLANAIKVCETDFSHTDQLPGLFRLAYLTNQGRRMPDLLRQQPTQAAPTIQSQPPRPTTAPSTMTPPPSTSPSQTSNWATDREARKALIKDTESRGLADQLFSNYRM